MNYKQIVHQYEMNYEKTLVDLLKMNEETIDYLKGTYEHYFNEITDFLLLLAKTEHMDAKEHHKKLYDVVNHYEDSYLNPDYTTSVFSSTIGPMLSSLYVYLRESIPLMFTKRIFTLVVQNLVVIELYEAFRNGTWNEEIIKEIITRPHFNKEIQLVNQVQKMREVSEPNYYNYLLSTREFKLENELYIYGKPIGENEKKLFHFMNNYDSEKIKHLAHSIVESFLRGFIVENKYKNTRNVVRIIYSIGQEALIKELIQSCLEHDLVPVIYDVQSSTKNKQYAYDHRFDHALFLNEEYTTLMEEVLKESFDENNDLIGKYCGIIVIENFGAKGFEPIHKDTTLKFTELQEQLNREYRNRLNALYNQVEPYEETSFSMIAFPTPEIGDQFEEIFEETMVINSMDNAHYERIQQHLINALDQAEYVHVLGKGTNKTDLKVYLPKLLEPTMQTNFVNCVADVNIPLGEVYTSPQLKHTSGLLHLKETFLDLKYHDLELYFEDGCVVDYNCKNFNDEEQNKKYVKENLLRFNENLPLGEFAIGTNTYAYAMAKKYNIMEVLPILIIEKMGPHFAIGDTCFSYMEDLAVFNLLNGKEVVARENERSQNRHTNFQMAYTSVHTDITIPYEDLDSIIAYTYEGKEIPIIKDGLFVLKGTEELNVPLRNY